MDFLCRFAAYENLVVNFIHGNLLSTFQNFFEGLEYFFGVALGHLVRYQNMANLKIACNMQHVSQEHVAIPKKWSLQMATFWYVV